MKNSDKLIRKFIGHIMGKGKKMVAEKLLLNSFKLVEKELQLDPVYVLKKVVYRVAPLVEVKTMRVRGSSYLVPFVIKESRRLYYVFVWLISSSKLFKGSSFSVCLAKELINCFYGRGESLTKKEKLYKTAEANRANAREKW